jgi:transcriptional regulator with XRE-family HTH domain
MSEGEASSVIRNHRHAKGLTQRQLAAQLGVSCAAVGQWETGVEIPKRTNAIALDDVLEAGGAIADVLGYTLRSVERTPELEQETLLRRIDALDAQVSELAELIRHLVNATSERASATSVAR